MGDKVKIVSTVMSRQRNIHIQCLLTRAPAVLCGGVHSVAFTFSIFPTPLLGRPRRLALRLTSGAREKSPFSQRCACPLCLADTKRGDLMEP